MIARARAVTAAVLALAAVLAPSAEANPRRFTPVAGKSEVTFTASFPLGNFTGRAEDVSGDLRADPGDLRQGIAGVVRINAAGLRTGDEGRDRDMHRALAVERHPEIRFTVERVEASFPSASDRTDVLLSISGVMSIRGVERPMVFPGRVRLRDDRLWVRGEGQLRMSDFGVKPPSRFLLEVKDLVSVSFDLTLAPE